MSMGSWMGKRRAGRSVAVTLVGLVLASASLTACGGGARAVRGSDVKGLDDAAMSTGLDKRDLEQMLHENMKALQSSAVVKR